MAQRSVLTQTTQPKEDHTTIRYRWMHRFFTTDVSPDNHPIVELQRRAIWFSIALILQAGNEISHDLYMPYLGPFGSLIPFALIAGSFIAIAMAFRPASLKRHVLQSRPRRWQRFVLVSTVLLTTAGILLFAVTIAMCFMPPEFSNDGTSLDTNAAVLLLHGKNPYTDSNMLDLARHFSIQPNWTTPLQRGQFANRIDYPSEVDFQTVLDTDLKAGTAPEFESKVSYPALSFLTLVPFAYFNDMNVLPFYLLSYLVLIGIAWKVARPEMRIWVLLLGLANVSMWASTKGANLDIFYTLLIVLVWLLRDKRWSSAIFLGLALASKQIAWFFIPFYIIMVLRHYGLKECVYRIVIAGSIGVAINLPFILWNPHAWVAGIIAPVADPMFPVGVGLVGVSATHLLPFFPKWVYTALEGGAMAACLVWYWRICKKVPEAAMLLAVLPLFFAWRSLGSYFYCVAYPMFILMAAKIPLGLKPRTVESRSHTIDLAYGRSERPLAVPSALSFRTTSYSAPIFHYRTTLRM